MARNRTMRGLGFNSFAIWCHKHRSHQPKRAKALCDCIGLHITIIILTCPDKSAFPLHCTGYHIVNQTMLISNACLLKLVFKLSLKYFLKQVLEAAIICFHDGVLSRQIDRPAKVKTIIHTGTRKTADRVIQIIHCHGNTAFGKIKYGVGGSFRAICRLEGQR